jgi:hypothetical protein
VGLRSRGTAPQKVSGIGLINDQLPILFGSTSAVEIDLFLKFREEFANLVDESGK